MNSAEILREAAYEEGYKAGKAAIVVEVFEDLEEMFNEKYEAVKKKTAEFVDGSDLNIYWTGRLTSYGEVVQALSMIKKKYKEEV